MQRRTALQFNSQVEALFCAAGWTADRCVDPAQWHDRLRREGFVLFPVAERVVRNVGRLIVRGPGRPETNEYSREVSFDPVDGGAGEYDRFEEWQRLTGMLLYPLADLNPRLSVMVGEDGSVYAGQMDLFYRWGDTFEKAMEVYFLGSRRPVEWPLTE
jgi:hypothetical protein